MYLLVKQFEKWPVSFEHFYSSPLLLEKPRKIMPVLSENARPNFTTIFHAPRMFSTHMTFIGLHICYFRSVNGF